MSAQTETEGPGSAWLQDYLEDRTSMRTPWVEPTKIKTEAIQSCAEKVTPGRAKSLLMYNRVSNRKIAMGRIERYATDLRNGDWRMTHQGLAIDEDGYLMDGQHRLCAIVKTGIPAEMMVTTGLSRDVFLYIDGGFNRQAQSFIEAPHSTNKSALARILMRIEELQDHNSMATITSGLTGNGDASHVVVSYWNKHSQIREYAEKYAGFAAAAKPTKSFQGFRSTTPVGLLVGGFIVGPDENLQAAWWNDINAILESSRTGLGSSVRRGNPLATLFRMDTPGGNMNSTNYARAIYVALKYRAGRHDCFQIRADSLTSTPIASIPTDWWNNDVLSW